MAARSKLLLEFPGLEVLDSVTLPARESAVIVVDMQNDFVKPGGRLRVPTAEATIPSISRLLASARSRGVRVFYTQDTHWPGDPEYEIWGEHVLHGSWGWQIVDELKPEKGDIVVVKTRYDGFYGTPLEDLLRVYGVKYTVIVGTVANICVLHTAGSAALRGFKVVVPMDGVSALNDFDYYAALRQISYLYRGLVVRSVDGIRFE
ncbi:MAG: isochorismatase family cysteine hydrolase [Acidilobaceae archaeon]